MPHLTEEMIRFQRERTQRHIRRVQKNMAVMAGYLNLTEEELSRRAQIHDQSKFEEPENQALVWLVWAKKCKNEGHPFALPEGMELKIEVGSQHHLKCNRHHPEAHADPNEMSDLDLVEMVCDWTAWSQEFNENGGSAGPWAAENISQWKFHESVRQKIFAIVQELDRRNKA